MIENFSKKETILVLGGDGFCGWPTSLGLSKAGYHIVIVDNLARRMMDVELECESLTPIQPINKRMNAWKELTGKQMDYYNFNVAQEYDKLLKLITHTRPKAIIHFAEQRAAPYSMKSSHHKRYTVNNNITATHNLLCAVVESDLDIHVIHLGSMGVYGYGTTGMKIPEGYLEVFVEKDSEKVPIEILYPANPGSIYHMTKTQDALLFYFYNKNDQIRVTDLHQGVVWGTNTPQTDMDERLINRFDYDGDFGTVLNRFLIQASVGHPLTVHGTGGQTRAFIHIIDSVNCLKLAIENPPEKGDRVHIYNQATETHTVMDLALRVAEITGAEIRSYINPRNEDAQNDLHISNDTFKRLGLKPITLNNGLLDEVLHVAEKYRHRCDLLKIPCVSVWKDDIPEDTVGTKTFSPSLSYALKRNA